VIERRAQSMEQTPPAAAVEFTTVYRDQFAYAWRTLHRLGVHDRDLPDLVHDFFVVVFRQLHLFDPTRPIRPWLFGVAFRVVSDYRRGARYTREVLEPPPEVIDRAAAADEQVADAEGRERVIQILHELELDRRAVFVMHDIDEATMPEIATALGIPLATAYSRLRLAREDVARSIKRWRAREERFR